MQSENQGQALLAQSPRQTSKNNSQVRALFLKNWQLQKKQPCTNICQIMTPVICLIFTYLIKQLASQNIKSGVMFEDRQYPFVFGDFAQFDKNSPQINNSKPINSSTTRSNPLQWFLYQCQSSVCDSTVLGKYNGDAKQDVASNITILGSIVNDKFYANNIPVTLDYYNNKTPANKFVPFFIQTKDVNSQIFKRIQKIQSSDFQTYKGGRNGLDTIPDGAFIFKNLTKNKMKVLIRPNDIRDLQLHRNNGYSALKETVVLKLQNLNSTKIYFTQGTEVITPYTFLRLQGLITKAFASIHNISMQSGYIFMRQTDSSQSFVDSIINTISALIFPLGLSLLFPVMLYTLVLQKQQRLVQMMKMNGMKISNYWLVYFLFNFLFCAITNIVFFMLGAFVLKTKFFRVTSSLLLLLVALGWSLAQIGIAAFCQTFLNKARSANIIGYIVAIWTMMISSTLNIGVYQIPQVFPGWLQALPPFAFNRIFYLMLSQCSDAKCYESISSITPEMEHCLLSLYFGFVVFFGLGAYLLQVLPQQFGLARHPLFPIHDLYRFITCSKKTTYTRPNKDVDLRRWLGNGEEDAFSLAQRQQISQIKQISAPLVINNLRKLYKKEGYNGPFAAVKSLNLKVEDKQTFGLLGPNGAGKTTLISMLTGMITPNYGNAWIGGYDILNNVAKSQLQMGVCPQFDLLWPQLTVEEHLQFYARLKGVSSKDLKRRVHEAIAQVNLSKFTTFLSSSLSGGMKRRLSIAISLVGDPRIVFLDQPSTGLDPDNRRQIWQVLVKCQQKRALFLTTHMMQQADALCHRIGIITHGVLRTVGSQLKLKKEYGQGYRMGLSIIQKDRKLINADALSLSQQNINLKEDEQQQQQLRRSIIGIVDGQNSGKDAKLLKQINRVKNYVEQKFIGSCVSRVLGASMIFKVPNSFKVSQILTEMHGIQKQLNITNVAVTECSLQDVFISVVIKYDKIDQDVETGQYILRNQIEKELVKQQQQMDRQLQYEQEQKQHQERKSSKSSNLFGSSIKKDRQSIMSDNRPNQ